MRKKKELLESAPWRGEEEDKFEDAKLRVTRQPGGGASTMYVPGKKSGSSGLPDVDDDGAVEIDPELRYSFQRNYQFLQRVFSIDTIVKPLPPAMGYNVSRNLSFFTRIFTQFFDPEGISNAQKSLGLGQEQKVRRVR
uniref:Phosphopantothenate--cysteine ligase 1 n=1 Tax=Anthurium amnicola TaxID=1678845 RepID=A0A1D1XZC6_9ARAE